MSDKIRGTVTTVVNEDTFQMYITHLNKGNVETYAENETIKIEGMLDSSMEVHTTADSRPSLESSILGKEVICYVEGRDLHNRILGYIHILPSG